MHASSLEPNYLIRLGLKPKAMSIEVQAHC